MPADPRSIEDIRRLVRHVTGRPGYSSFVGTTVVSVEIGNVEMSLERRPELAQATGYFHGGVICGLADHAAGAAATSTLPADRFAITVDINVHFLDPADGDRLIARAEVMKTGSSLSTVDVRLFAADGEKEQLCAIATATMRSIPMPASRALADPAGEADAPSS